MFDKQSSIKTVVVVAAADSVEVYIITKYAADVYTRGMLRVQEA